MISPARKAEEMLTEMHEQIRFGKKATDAAFGNVISEAQVYALLAIAEAIQGMDSTLHDALRAIATSIGDLSER